MIFVHRLGKILLRHRNEKIFSLVIEMIVSNVDINDNILVEKIIKLIYKTFCECNKIDSSTKLIKRYKDLYGENYDYNKTLKYLKNYSKIFIVVRDGDNIVGVIRGLKNKIINLYIDHDYQGRGIGKYLLEFFEAEVKKLGSTYIILKSSKYAKDFYIKHGYIIKNKNYLEKSL